MSALARMHKVTLSATALLGGIIGVIGGGYGLWTQFLRPPPPTFKATFGVDGASQLMAAPQASPNDPDPKLHLIPAGLILTNVGGEPAKNVTVTASVLSDGLNLHVAGADSHPYRAANGKMTWQYTFINLGTVNPGDSVRKSKELYFSVEKDLYKQRLRGVEVITKDGKRLRLTEEAIESYDWAITGYLELAVTAENMKRMELRLPVEVGSPGHFRSRGVNFQHIRMRGRQSGMPPGPVETPPQ